MTPVVITILVVLGLISLLTWGIRGMHNEAVDVHDSLNALWAKAKTIETRDELLALRRDLVAFAKEKCWHRAYGTRAAELCAYIDGRLRGCEERRSSIPGDS